MNKSDLRTGMMVTLRNGGTFYILLNTGMLGEMNDVLVRRSGNDMGWMPLRNYSEDLRHHDAPGHIFDEDLLPDETDRDWDIMEVYAVKAPCYIGIRSRYKLHWKRDN